MFYFILSFTAFIIGVVLIVLIFCVLPWLLSWELKVRSFVGFTMILLLLWLLLWSYGSRWQNQPHQYSKYRLIKPIIKIMPPMEIAIMAAILLILGSIAIPFFNDLMCGGEVTLCEMIIRSFNQED